MRVLGFVAALALLSTLPPASAQVPDPSEAVNLACTSVGSVAPQARDLIPLCPRDEPVTQPSTERPAAAPPAPPGPPSPEDVATLAEEIAEEAQAIPEDPTSAGDRILAIVAIVVEFVKDLLSIPVSAAAAVGDAIGAAVAAVGDALTSVGSAIRDVGAGALDAIKSLFEGSPAAPATPELPGAKPRVGVPDAGGLLDRVTGIVPG